MLEKVEAMERNYRFFFLHVPLAIAAALLTTSRAAAEEPPFAGSSVMIRDLLAEKPGQAVCFNGKFKGLKVNVWDDAKIKRVPEPGVFQSGKQVMRSEPAVSAGQEVSSLTLLIAHGSHESESWDETHDFRLKATLRGRRGALYSIGECPYRRTDRSGEERTKANTTKLSCFVFYDGGGMEVERVPGGGDVFFRFGHGLRMSRRMYEEGDLHLGVPLKPYGPPEHEEPPVAFRLTRMMDKACAAFRKATDGPND
jgi:hypothetical protein